LRAGAIGVLNIGRDVLKHLVREDEVLQVSLRADGVIRLD